MLTVMGICLTNSPMMPLMNIIGKNAATVVMVPEMIGHWNSRTTRLAASFGCVPFLTSSCMPSTTTMPVSTTTPSARIKENSERKLTVEPTADRPIKPNRNVRGTVIPASNASRQPRNTSRSSKIMATVCRPLPLKSLMDLRISFALSNTVITSDSGNSWLRTSSTTFLDSSTMRVISPPVFLKTDNVTAAPDGLPS